ncbi:hypothetical protein EOD43_05850 [Sphingomonas crocodyli]|uniref:Uncharacterized protein n=2 Tax=Sphingomonas crocodyli TaxID=1979270 RepID=A0A437MBS1_9SPHN|nr:hypothetical protein EOD43_05850 [Sphingomonas crocodyli]
MPADERMAAIGAIKPCDLRKVRYGWGVRARASQCAPEGDWRLWLILAGRGFGKTRAGAEWVRGVAERDGTARIALVAASIAEARAVMVEGPSGLLNIGDPTARPTYESSLRRLKWKGGAEAALYSAAEAEMLRGPQHSHAWADEIAKWPNAIETWDNLTKPVVRTGGR